MDQSQKERIASVEVEIAGELKAEEFARRLQMIKLVPKTRVEDIFTRVNSNFTRNMQLLYAVQECGTDSAFSDFIDVLEDLDSTSVSKLVKKTSPGKNRPKSCKDILGLFRNKFTTKNQYPLGLNSGLSSGFSTSRPYQPSSTTQSSYQSDTLTISSPYKEKHQTTLISSNSSGSNSFSQSQQRQQECDSTPTEFKLSMKKRDGHPVGPFTPATKSRNNHLESNRTQQITNSSSQTPSRSSDSRLTHNSSLPDEGLQQQRQRLRLSIIGGRQDDPQNDGGDEPVISWHPYAQSPTHENAPRACSPHLCHPCYSSASSESGESSSDSLIVDPNLILDSNVMTAIAREGPNMMSVKIATTCHNDPEEDYKMTSRPRGNCLIVNNINFEGDIFPTRKGSDEDANRFDQIFRQLGFETIMTRNLTADQMRAKFRELSAACKPEHDALFVFILSHGSENGIYGTDGMEVYLESEIISCFDNRNCKAMIGKPKVFVIQACRGRSKDCGGEGDTTDSVAWTPVTASPAVVRSLSQENRVPDSWLPSQPSDGKKRKHPIRTDMLLVFSCLAGEYREKSKSGSMGRATAEAGVFESRE